MSETDEFEALQALKTMPMLLAWVFKTGGADGVKALFEGDITGCEYVQGWADQLRAMRLTKLADLLDGVAETMPPSDVIVNPKLPHGFDRELELRWKAWVAAHPDDERVIEHDRQWREARAAWLNVPARLPPIALTSRQHDAARALLSSMICVLCRCPIGQRAPLCPPKESAISLRQRPRGFAGWRVRPS